MRIGLVVVSQESNTFNPEPTTIERFATYGIHRGDEVLTVDRGQIAGHLAAAAERGGVETVPIFNAKSVAAGRLSRATVDTLADEVISGLEAALPLDGLNLQLHGACAAEGIDDVEGHLLRLVRTLVGPDLPIGLGLDHHANVTEAMIAQASVIVGHRTQPHDLYDTGCLTAHLLFRLVAGEVNPTAAWNKLPLLSHQEQYLTERHPMKTWFDRARQIEADDPKVLQISNFPMQPWLDVEGGGWSTVVVTDNDEALARQVADEMADLAWSMRAEFQVRTSLPPAEAVARAAATEGLVVLSDTGDSVRGGAGGDSTVLLDEMLAQGVTGALVTVVDPDIATKLAGAAVGSTVTVTTGGGVAHVHAPITITGTLQLWEPVVVRIGGVFANPVADHGWTAVIEIACGHVVISEFSGIGGVHPDMYPQVGLDVSEHAIAVVKTASNFQYFTGMATEVVRADTKGPTQSAIADLPWQRIPRPVYPLDPVADWRR